MYVFPLVLCFFFVRVHGAHYTQQWVVHVEGGPKVAEAVARDHGFTNLGEVSDFLFHPISVTNVISPFCSRFRLPVNIHILTPEITRIGF